MLFILGVGSLVALKACAVTVIMDSFPTLKIWHVSLGVAIAGFLVGLVYITPVSWLVWLKYIFYYENGLLVLLQ